MPYGSRRELDLHRPMHPASIAIGSRSGKRARGGRWADIDARVFFKSRNIKIVRSMIRIFDKMVRDDGYQLASGEIETTRFRNRPESHTNDFPA
jgi:hypothetical protein